MKSSGNAGIVAGKQRAARLREALRRRGVKKLYSLALDLGVDQSTISRWINDGGMSLDHAAALCSQLAISLDWLVIGRGGMEAEGMSGSAAELTGLLDALEPEIVAALTVIARAVERGR